MILAAWAQVAEAPGNCRTSRTKVMSFLWGLAARLYQLILVSLPVTIRMLSSA
jgi:hypothetical protein